MEAIGAKMYRSIPMTDPPIDWCEIEKISFLWNWTPLYTLRSLTSTFFRIFTISSFIVCRMSTCADKMKMSIKHFRFPFYSQYCFFDSRIMMNSTNNCIQPYSTYFSFTFFMDLVFFITFPCFCSAVFLGSPILKKIKLQRMKMHKKRSIVFILCYHQIQRKNFSSC